MCAFDGRVDRPHERPGPGGEHRRVVADAGDHVRRAARTLGRTEHFGEVAYPFKFFRSHPHPLTPSPLRGEGGHLLFLFSPLLFVGEGLGVRGPSTAYSATR